MFGGQSPSKSMPGLSTEEMFGQRNEQRWSVLGDGAGRNKAAQSAILSSTPAVQNERQPRNTATVQPPADFETLYSTHANFLRQNLNIL
jgi:hypothetical protein